MSIWKLFDYTNASLKVLYDKSYDYLLNMNQNETEEGNDSENLENYDSIIKIDNYENENETNRICPQSSYYDSYTAFFSSPTHIVDNIYLGSAFNAACYDILIELNINVVINATYEISEYFPNRFIYLRYKLYDNNKHSIKKYLEQAYNDIIYHQANTSGNILIHCFMGASRSASIVLYYLMKTRSLTFDGALSYLKTKRGIVNPTFRLTKDLASSISQKLVVPNLDPIVVKNLNYIP